MFDKIQMTLMIKTSILNNRISRLNWLFLFLFSISFFSRISRFTAQQGKEAISLTSRNHFHQLYRRLDIITHVIAAASPLVPQGPILGPLLLNRFINNLIGFTKKSSLYNFSDDYTIATLGDYIYDVHAEKGWGSLEISYVFADFIVYFIFGDVRDRRVEKLITFCGRHKWMTLSAKDITLLKKTFQNEVEIAIQWFKDNIIIVNPDKFQSIIINRFGKMENKHKIYIENKKITSENFVILLSIELAN